MITLFNLPVTNNTWTSSMRHYASYISVGYISYFCKIPKFWINNLYLKNKKEIEKRKIFGPNERFRSWKQILEALLRVQCCFLQIKVSKILNMSVDQICFKTRGRVCQTLDWASIEKINSPNACLCYNTVHAVPISHAWKTDITWNNLHHAYISLKYRTKLWN